MKTSFESLYLFAVCQVGAEKALKAEVLREHPDLRFAFSRPGFITFKNFGGPLKADFELKSVFSRAYGLSLGEKASEASLSERVRTVLKKAQMIRDQMGRPDGSGLRLHVFEREQFAPGEEPMGFEPGKWQLAAQSAIQKAIQDAIRAEVDSSSLKGLFLPDDQAQPGDLVFDVICVEEGEWWLGLHLHGGRHAPVPGGRWEIDLPDEAPSRAYLKLEEALRWSSAPIQRGDQAVEIGSAPGGASYALLQRGVNVVGIDPGEMDPRVLRFSTGTPKFEHIPKSVVIVRREELPNRVQWLLVDMNTGPDTALTSVERLGRRMSRELVGVILTLKLNEWDFAQYIPKWLERIQDLGISRLRATQLSHNRREICVVGLTAKGVSRQARGRS